MKTQTIVICFILFSQICTAQLKIEDASYEDVAFAKKGMFYIAPLIGYQLNGSLKLNDAKIKINNASNIGIEGAYYLSNSFAIDFRYSTSKTQGDYISEYNSSKDDRVRSDHYLMGVSLCEPTHRVVPFTGVTFGVAYHQIKGDVEHHIANFSSAIKGGLIINVNQHIGIILCARLLATTKYESINPEFVFTDSGNDFYLNLDMSTPVLQGDFSAGLTIYIDRI